MYPSPSFLNGVPSRDEAEFHARSYQRLPVQSTKSVIISTRRLLPGGLCPTGASERHLYLWVIEVYGLSFKPCIVVLCIMYVSCEGRCWCVLMLSRRPWFFWPVTSKRVSCESPRFFESSAFLVVFLLEARKDLTLDILGCEFFANFFSAFFFIRHNAIRYNNVIPESLHYRARFT